MKKIFTFSLDPDLHKKFKEYCNKNGFNMSAKIELFMESEVYGKK